MIPRCSGAKSVRQIVRERAKQTLKQNEHTSLDKDIEQKVKEIIRDRNDIWSRWVRAMPPTTNYGTLLNQYELLSSTGVEKDERWE